MKSNTEMAKMAFRYFGGIAALFILSATKLDAQQIKAEEKPALVVTYQQTENDYLVFKITATNMGNKKSVLKVSDTNLDVLYTETIYADSFIKTVKVPKYDLESIEFRVSNGKDFLRKAFDVKLITTEAVEVVAIDL